MFNIPDPNASIPGTTKIVEEPHPFCSNVNALNVRTHHVTRMSLE